MSFYAWRKAVKVFFCGPEKPEPKEIRYWYHKFGTGTYCNECEVRGNSIPAVEHHPKCLTGQKEKTRRKPNPGPLPAKRPTPFRPRVPLAVDQQAATEGEE